MFNRACMPTGHPTPFVGRRVLVVLVALLWVVSAGGAAAQGDPFTASFLPNADFANAPGGRPAGWRLAQEGRGELSVVSQRDARSAPHSLAFANAGDGQVAAISSVFRQRPPAVFQMAGHARVRGNPKAARLVVQSMDGNWGTVDWVTIDLQRSADWRPFEREVRLSDQARHVQLMLQIEGAGTVHLDDLSLRVPQGQRGAGPVYNPQADARRPRVGQAVTLADADVQDFDYVIIGSGGTVTSLVQHPTDHDTIYMAVDVGGPHRWDEADQKWVALVDHFGPDNTKGYHTELIALDPHDPDVVIFSAGKEWLTGRDGVYRSEDRGETWNFTTLQNAQGQNVFISNGRFGWRLNFDPHARDVVYYGSIRDGFYVSEDGGRSFDLVENFPVEGADSRGLHVRFIVPDASSGTAGNGRARVQYAALNRTDRAPESPGYENGFYRTQDGGETWQRMGNGAPHNASTAEVDENGTLYTVGTGGVHRLRDDSWENITPTDRGRDNFSTLTVSPHDPDVIFVGERHCGWGNSIHRSTDGGQSWTRYNDAHFERGQRTSVAGDIQPWERTTSGGLHAYACMGTLTIDRRDPAGLWMTLWPGTWRSSNALDEIIAWNSINAGHEETCLFDLISPPTGAPLLSGLMDVGGFRHADLQEIPDTVLAGVSRPGNPAPEDISALDFAEENPDLVVMAAGWKFNNTGNAGYSTDNGRTWQNFATKPFNDARNGRIAVSSDGQSIVWLPRGNVPPYVTTDRGATWTPSSGVPRDMIFDGFVYTFYMPLVADRVTAGTYYLYDRRDGRFYRSTDHAKAFEHVGSLPRQPGAHFDQHRLVATPDAAGEVWAALDTQGLFHTADGGQNWEQLAGVSRAWRFGLGAPLSEGQPPAAYLLGRVDGDDLGDQQVALYRSTDAGRSWTRLSDPDTHGMGQATVVIGCRQTPGRVYVGHNGRGIWYADAP